MAGRAGADMTVVREEAKEGVLCPNPALRGAWRVEVREVSSRCTTRARPMGKGVGLRLCTKQSRWTPA